MEWFVNDNYYEYLNDDFDKLVLIGGANSGKSFFVLEQWLIFKLLSFENRTFLVLRKIARTSKNSTVEGVLSSLSENGLIEDVHYSFNKTDKEIKVLQDFGGKKTKGNKIIFTGLDDPTKVKSIKGISDIVLEEASDFKLFDYNELKVRLRDKNAQNQIKNKQMVLMMNPTDEFDWHHKFFEVLNDKEHEITMTFSDDDIEELAGKPKKWTIFEEEKINDKIVKEKVKVFKSNYDDNILLDDKSKMAIESLKKTDINLWRRYRLGVAEKREELIFQNWEIGEMDINQFDKFKYGLDFGFSNDPTSLTEIAIHNDVLYISRELIYSTGLTNNDISDIILNEGLERQLIAADSAEPKSIEEIKQRRINIIAAQKGKGSIESGIKKMKEYKIIINPKCTNAINEFKNYKFKVDKNGNVLPVVVDDFNHLIDSIRYSLSVEEEKSFILEL